jgi:probable phosphoglycerate mutase
LIRHGESLNQVEGVIGGPKGDTGLTERGGAQARALADRLADGTGVSALLSSSLPRAVDTAKIIAPAVGDPVIEPLDGLAYRWPAEADGMFLAKHRRLHALSGGGVFRPYQQGEESWAEFVARVGATLAKISCDHVGERVAVITHDEVIDASFRVFGDLPLRSRIASRIPPTSITEWSTTDDPNAGGPPDYRFARWSLDRFNDIAHLETMADQGDPCCPYGRRGGCVDCESDTAVAAMCGAGGGATVSGETGPMRRQEDLGVAVGLLRREGLITGDEPVECTFLPGGSVAVTVLVTGRRRSTVGGEAGARVRPVAAGRRGGGVGRAGGHRHGRRPAGAPSGRRGVGPAGPGGPPGR